MAEKEDHSAFKRRVVGMPTAFPGKSEICDRDHRLVECIFATELIPAKERDGLISIPKIDPAAADFSRVNDDRAPVLISHLWEVEGIIGKVEAAWIVGARAHAILRIGYSPRAEPIWSAISDNLPLAVSMGFKILDLEPTEQPTTFLVTKWLLQEISICTVGADPGARVLDVKKDREQLVDAIETKRHLSVQERLAARVFALEGPAWNAWVEKSAPELAAQFAIDPMKFKDELLARVQAHLVEIAQ